MKDAPTFNIKGKYNCVPQHYLKYQHNLESVESIINDISYSDKYPIFVCNDLTGLYLQVGVIGWDNYVSKENQNGRRLSMAENGESRQRCLHQKSFKQHTWRSQKQESMKLENYSSLIIDHGYGKSTPFNTHHDISLLTLINHEKIEQHKDANRNEREILASISSWLSIISFDTNELSLEKYTSLSNGEYLLELILKNKLDLIEKNLSRL